MKENILQYARENNISIREDEEAFILLLEMNSFRIEILLPKGEDLLEWFIEVIEKGSEEKIFTDFIDHYETAGESDDQLALELEESVINTLKAIQQHPVRVVSKPLIRVFGKAICKTQVLELKTDKGWVEWS